MKRRNRYRKDRYGHIMEDIYEDKDKEVEVSNLFDALEQVNECDKVNKAEEAQNSSLTKKEIKI